MVIVTTSMWPTSTAHAGQIQQKHTSRRPCGQWASVRTQATHEDSNNALIASSAYAQRTFFCAAFATQTLKSSFLTQPDQPQTTSARYKCSATNACADVMRYCAAGAVQLPVHIIRALALEAQMSNSRPGNQALAQQAARIPPLASQAQHCTSSLQQSPRRTASTGLF